MLHGAIRLLASDLRIMVNKAMTLARYLLGLSWPGMRK